MCTYGLFTMHKQTVTVFMHARLCRYGFLSRQSRVRDLVNYLIVFIITTYLIAYVTVTLLKVDLHVFCFLIGLNDVLLGY